VSTIETSPDSSTLGPFSLCSKCRAPNQATGIFRTAGLSERPIAVGSFPSTSTSTRNRRISRSTKTRIAFFFCFLNKQVRVLSHSQRRTSEVKVDSPWQFRRPKGDRWTRIPLPLLLLRLLAFQTRRSMHTLAPAICPRYRR
jgi:hypothetical protein